MEIMKIYIIGEKLERSELLKQKKQLVCKAAWGLGGAASPPPSTEFGAKPKEISSLPFS